MSTILVQTTPATPGLAIIKPARFLGDRFALYRDRLESVGARFNWNAKHNELAIDRLPKCITVLEAAGFQIVLAPDLAQQLAREAQAIRADLSAGEQLVARIDAELAERGLTLFQHQREGIAWLAPRRRALLADAMGLGKSNQALLAVPRDVPVTIVCPASVKLNWAREIALWRPDLRPRVLAGRKSWQWPLPGEAVIANYEILPKAPKNRAEEEDITRPGGQTALIVDEAHYCFPAGTMVATTIGPMEISALVRERKQVSILSWNRRSASVEAQPIEDWLSFPIYNDLVRITHEHGTLTCTADHKIWTTEGWIVAGAIESGASLRVVQDGIHDANEREDHCEILFAPLRLPGGQFHPRGQSQDEPTAPQAPAREALRTLRSLVSVSISRPSTQPAAKVLRDLLLGQVANVSAKIQGIWPKGSPCRPGTPPRKEGSSGIKAHARAQSHARSCCARKNAPIPEWTHVSGAWRQWATDTPATCAARSLGAPNGVRDQDCASARPLSVSSVVLQGRPGAPAVSIGDRGGRKNTPTAQVALPGRQKDRDTELSRVVRVEVLERGHHAGSGVRRNNDSRVYCLSIAGNHNFFADGVLVANCKNARAARTKNVRACAKLALEASGRVYLLTGTPLTNRPIELWHVLNAAGLADDAFGSFKVFQRLMGGTEGRWGLEWTGAVDPSVPARLRQVSLYRRREDVLDLPPKMRVPVHVPGEFPPDVRKLLDALLAVLDAQGIDLDRATELVDLTRVTGAAFEQLAAARAALATAKIPAMVEAIQEYEEAEEPVLVFSAHRAPIDLLSAREGWATITGDTLSADRQAIVDAFQAGELKGLGLTIKAGGIGITLTRAAHEIFVDCAWTPADNNQAEDRAMRIGQTRPVLIKRLVANHEVDRRVEAILRAKQALIDAAIEPSAIAGGLGNRATAPLAAQAQSLEQTLARAGRVAPPPAPTRPPVQRHGPQTALEYWIADSLAHLAGNDPNHASVINDVGFNKLDNDFGHSLARQLADGGLTPRQWDAARQMLAKYHRQIGSAPIEETA